MTYDINGRAVEDEPDSGVPIAFIAVVAAILVIAAIGCYMHESEPVEQPELASVTYALHLDCGNAAMMHEHGLPTKADVMQWHYHGQWGYYQDGMLHVFDDLPGRNDTWDKLYEIRDNPAFDK